MKICRNHSSNQRGTSDSGTINIDDNEPAINDGNFRVILRMRMKCGDKNLIDHSKSRSLNATYFNPKIRNEIITICSYIIQQKLAEPINNAASLSILADETTDITKQEQMTICVRYVDKNEDV